MDRSRKLEQESANSVAAQKKMTSKSRESEAVTAIDESPLMVSQRAKLQSLFGGAAQRQASEEELLQGKFEAAQRMEEEEPFQGKFAVAQRADEEELLQGKFEAAQRVEEEEPLQGKFSVAQRAEEEELLQGKFEPAQRVEEEEPLQGKFAVAQRAEEEELLQGKFEPAQRMEEEEPLQGRFAVAQRAEEEELLQGKFEGAPSAQRKEEPATKPNDTGLPDNLKSGIESLSGMSMDNVKVHYNSSQPAQLNALAYAQGTDIHVAPGQEKHLPHEAWHVVQQAQGRVKPTTQMKGAAVNDDAGLEREADVMGGRAVQMLEMQNDIKGPTTLTGYPAIAPVTQLKTFRYKDGKWVEESELDKVGTYALPDNAMEDETFDDVTGIHRTGSGGIKRKREPEEQGDTSKDKKRKLDPVVARQQEYGSNVVESMAAMENGNVWYEHSFQEKYPDDWKNEYTGGYTEAEQLEKTDNMMWKLKPGYKASEAIKAWMNGLTIAECGTVLVVSELNALRLSVGDTKFDSMFGGDDKNVKPSIQPLIICGYINMCLPDEVLSLPQDMVIGQRFYFSNVEDYKYRHPAGAFQGENAIYLGMKEGVRRWTGFGVPECSTNAMFNLLYEEYRCKRDEEDYRRIIFIAVFNNLLDEEFIIMEVAKGVSYFDLYTTYRELFPDAYREAESPVSREEFDKEVVLRSELGPMIDVEKALSYKKVKL